MRFSLPESWPYIWPPEVGTHPDDVSAYGVADCAGGVREWTGTAAPGVRVLWFEAVRSAGLCGGPTTLGPRIPSRQRQDLISAFARHRFNRVDHGHSDLEGESQTQLVIQTGDITVSSRS